jgi:hypothetical protein
MEVSGQLHALIALLQRKEPPVPIGQEAGCAPEPVWTRRLSEKSFAPAGNLTPIVQQVAIYFPDWSTPVPLSRLMKQSPWKAYSRWASQKIPRLLWNRFKTADHWCIFRASQTQSPPSQHNYVRSNVIISSHLRLCVSSDLFLPSGF